jgi:hypothetical protein
MKRDFGILSNKAPNLGLFSEAVNAYKRIIKKPLSMGRCEVSKEADPLCNYVLKLHQSWVYRIGRECDSASLLMSFHENWNRVWQPAQGRT